MSSLSSEIIAIETDLSPAFVARYYQLFNRLPLPKHVKLVIDLKQARELSTAGTALLLWLRAQTQGEIILANLSPQARALLKLYLRDYPIFQIIDDPSLIPTIRLKSEISRSHFLRDR